VSRPITTDYQARIAALRARGRARRRALQLRRASSRHYEKKQAEYKALGLNSRGQTPKRAVYHWPVHGLKRQRLRRRLYAQRNRAAGLTWRGNPIKPIVPLTGLDRAWRAFRQTIAVHNILDLDPSNL